MMISPESAGRRAEAALTAAEPQVGQRGTTVLGINSCTPSNSPREVQSTQRIHGSGVFEVK